MKREPTRAFYFALTVGIVNLFGDMTYEGGASAARCFAALVSRRESESPPRAAMTRQSVATAQGGRSGVAGAKRGQPLSSTAGGSHARGAETLRKVSEREAPAVH